MKSGWRWTTRERRGMSHAEAGALGGRRGRPPIPEATRRDIVRRYRDGSASQRSLAREYGLSQGSVCLWCRTYPRATGRENN